MGEPPGFKLFKLFNSRAQLNNLNNLNPGGGPRGGVRDPPRKLNNLNPGVSPVFKLFNSRPRASPRTPCPGFKLFKLFKLFNSRPQLNNLNTGRPPDLNYLIPGVQTHWNTIWGLFGSWRVESCQHTHIQLPNRPGLSHTRPPPSPCPSLEPVVLDRSSFRVFTCGHNRLLSFKTKTLSLQSVKQSGFSNKW